MNSTLVLASLPEIFLCSAICLLLTYGVLPNPRNSTIGANGNAYRRRISARLGHNQPYHTTVPTLKGLEHDPAGKPVASERHPFTLVDGPTRGLFDGLSAYTRRAWLSCFTLIRTCLLCVNADGLTSATTFLYDPAGSRVKTVRLCVALLLFALATQPTQKLYPFERLVLRLGAIAGLRFLVSAYDLVAFYLALELQSFCLYILAARKRTSEFSTEAGIKYFRLGAFSSGWILFGSALIYGFTGTTNFEDLGNLFTALTISASTGRAGLEGIQGDGSIAGDAIAVSRDYLFGASSFLGLEGVFVGRIFIRVGLFFKLAAAPFHLWAPDVYEGAPTFVTAFFAVIPKIALLTLFCRLYYNVFEFAFAAVTQPRLATVAALSRIFGTLGGLYQVKIKRLRAYSAIGHRGYRRMGRSAGTLEGVQAVFLYRGIYRVTSLGFFTVLLRIKKVKSAKSSDDRTSNGSGSSEGTSLVYLTDLVDLGKSNPYVGVIVARLFFSRAGVPPLAGFFAKYYVFFAAVSAEQYGLALLAVITSTASCFYYLRVVKFRYFTGPEASKGRRYTEWPRFRAVSFRHALVVVRITRFILGFFFCPEPFLLAAQSLAFTLVA